jgi:hypothetical protein
LFATPIDITADTPYVVSYHTNVGQYSLTANGFGSAHTSGALTAPAGAARYLYGSGGFPTETSNHNYWVDVVFVANSLYRARRGVREDRSARPFS